ncbi:MAG: methyltransferase domain-containing protein [Acidimicrobiales bacterium]
MEIANVEMFEAWNGQEGDDWTANAARYEGSGRRHRPHLINPSIIGAGDRVLDIGCGTGRSAIEAAKLATDGSTLGIDLSAQMLAFAREQAAAEGVTNVTFVQGDAQVQPFEPGALDVAISDSGVMFFADPIAAFANIGEGLRAGGRLALIVWRELQENAWLTTIRSALALGRELGTPPPDAPTPFSMADPDRVQARLTAAGFSEIQLEPIDEPMEMGADADESFAFFKDSGIVRGLLDGVDDAGRAEGLDNLHIAFKEAETAEGVLLGSACWLVTATRA